MKLLLSALCASLLAYPLLANGPGPSRGLVVEAVEKDSADQVAGIQTGDILVSWKRDGAASSSFSPSAGEFRSPFDFDTVAIEQAPRGQVAISATRAGRPVTFRLYPDNWTASVRPRFEGATLAAYHAGELAVAQKELEDGTRQWQALASRLSYKGDYINAAWLYKKAADALREGRRQKDSYEAIDHAIEAAALSGNGDALGQLWFAKGELFQAFDDYAEALKCHQRALEIQRRAGLGPLRVAWTLAEMAIASTWIDDLANADAYGKEALKIRQKSAPHSIAVASTYITLSNVAYRRSEHALDEEYCRQAHAILHELVPGTKREAHALVNLSVSTAIRGNLALAEDLQRQALAIRQRIAPEEVAHGLGNLGSIAADRGDLAGAEVYFLRGLTLAETTSPRSVFSRLRDLGSLALRRGDLMGAEAYFQRALVWETAKAPEGPNLAWTLEALGQVRRQRGDYDSADEYLRKALSLRRKLSPDSPATAAVLAQLSRLSCDRGNIDAAKSLAEEALEMRERASPHGLLVADSNVNLARLADEQRDFAEAATRYERALDIRERLAPDTQETAALLHAIGDLYRRYDRLDKAAQYMRRAIDAMDVAATRIGGSEESTSAFSSTYSDYYHDYVEVLILLKRPTACYDILERSRARFLLTMMRERDISPGSDTEADLELDRRRADADYDLAQGDLNELSPQRDGDKITELKARLRDLRAEQQRVADRIKRTSPRYASLQYPQPLDLGAARAVLDSGTVLVAYSVGKTNIIVFVVEPAQTTGPGLTVDTISINDKTLRESIEAFRNLLDHLATSGSVNKDVSARARSLYDTLLKPVEPLVARYDRILILPDGALHTLPWASLVRDVKNGKPEYLVEWKPIHIAISATVYAELKKARKDTPRDPSVIVAAFGDPKYPKLPEKEVAAKRSTGEDAEAISLVEDLGEGDDPQVRSVVRGGFRFEPLPASRNEVESIASLYAPKSAAYLGSDATEERAKSIGKDVPLIHFATHAVINERFPLDSALVFTIPEHPKEGQDNGLLQAWEIFERVRIDADLVTLSACESGLGKEMGGEGLIGLTRAFQYAGARSVLASLWKVDDKATGELMKRFYRYLKAGNPKDQALRLAQIDLIHSPDYSQPRDWAAFQLNGDWK